MTATGAAGTVRSVRAAAYRIPLEAPEADGTFEWDATTVVVVRVHADEADGLGWTYSDASVAGLVASLLAPVVEGRSLDDVRGANAAMRRALRNVGSSGTGAAALSAVDVALWDAHARAHGTSLVTALGSARESVPVYGSGGFTTLAGGPLADQLTGWVEEQGARAVKMKVGEAFGSREQRDLARAETARAAVGPDVDLFIDANGGYTRAQAARLGRRYVEELAVRWFEEPVSSDDVSGLALLRGELEVDIAAGEYTWRPQDAQRLLGASAVDCLQADVTRCGGFTGWLDVAALARAQEVQTSTHCAPQLSVQAACATPEARHVEWFADHVHVERLLLDGVLEPVDGVLMPDRSRPGHGLTLRSADVRRYVVAGDPL